MSTKNTKQSAPQESAESVETSADHAAALAQLRSDLARVTSEKEALERDVQELRGLLDACTEPQGQVKRRVVHVRARNPNLLGFELFGRPLTAEWFELDVTGWSEKRLLDLDDPNAIVSEI